MRRLDCGREPSRQIRVGTCCLRVGIHRYLAMRTRMLLRLLLAV